MSDLQIREFTEADWPDIWNLLHGVFQDGKTYPYPAETSEAQARHIWLAEKTATYVVREIKSRAFLGTYYLKPNQPGRGAHVCNCGYVTSSAARGRGIATAMCEHSQRVALKKGFKAMQFNFVVSTNEGAVRLWRKLGFDIIGTLPEVFHHAELGLVDAHIMFKRLEPDGDLVAK